jgi:hypothetical protein
MTSDKIEFIQGWKTHEYIIIRLYKLFGELSERITAVRSLVMRG